MILDVIIPCYNEAKNLEFLLPYLLINSSGKNINILVVDAANSVDTSNHVCEKHGVSYLKSEATQRSIQMNQGAKHLDGNVLLFLHADVKPPKHFYQLIANKIALGTQSGCFAYEFESSKILLRLNSFFTQFKSLFTGGGDQALFITKTSFDSLNGFCAAHVIMEDYELYRRIKSNKIKFSIIKSRAKVSARKYEKNSWVRVNLINLISVLQYKVDRDPLAIKSFYKKWLNT